jgi:hypothetical protein
MLNVNETKRMEALTAGLPSKSAKMRALAKAGYERADIARFLGVKYQFVRNVLVQDETRLSETDAPSEAGKATSATGAADPGMAVRITIAKDGSVHIPGHLLAAAGTAPGQVLLARFEDDEIKLVTPDATKRQIRAAMRKYVPEGVSLVDDLLQERRREVDREQGRA